MPGENAFTVEGTVMEALPNGTYWVELSNGHRLRGYVAGKRKLMSRRLLAGEVVRLELSPYDLSEARILAEQEKI